LEVDLQQDVDLLRQYRELEYLDARIPKGEPCHWSFAVQ
jgi:hypothetical protein